MEATGRGQAAAAAAYLAERPDDAAKSGTWTVSVKLVSAPGPVPDTDGSTAAAQSASDGKEQFVVSYQAYHLYAKILPSGVAGGDHRAHPVAQVDTPPA